MPISRSLLSSSWPDPLPCWFAVPTGRSPGPMRRRPNCLAPTSQRPLSDFLDGEPEALAAATAERAAAIPAAGRRRQNPFWAFTNVSNSQCGYVLQILEADEYVRAGETLAYQESIFRHAIEAAEHAVWEYNANNEALFYSDAWKAMRGFPRREFHDS